MRLRPLGPDVLADAEAAEEADVRSAEDETEKEGCEQDAEGEDRH